MKTTIWIILIVFGLFFIGYEVKKHPCIKSHMETQYEAPPSVVVGGGKYGGGIAMPVGNIKQVEVEVCDEYK